MKRRRGIHYPEGKVYADDLEDALKKIGVEQGEISVIVYSDGSGCFWTEGGYDYSLEKIEENQK